MKLTLECCAIAGRAVEKFLPKNLKPAIRDVIDEGLGIKTGGAGAGAETRAAATAGSAARPTEPRGRAAPGTPPARAAGGGVRRRVRGRAGTLPVLAPVVSAASPAPPQRARAEG